MRSETSREILCNILKCTVAFYSVYYVNAGILFGAFRLERFDGTMPFDFKHWIDLTQCCRYYPPKQIANLITMFLTYFVSSWCFVVFIKDRVWDYAVTVTVIHIALSCLVMISFPFNWSWWICIGLGLVIMISIGEIVSYFLRKAKENNTVSKE